MKKIYSFTRKILADDVDMFRNMRHSVFLRWLQEASIAHTEALGAGRDKTLDKGALWVVARISVEIRRMPCYDETVTFRTWAGKTRHVLFPRYYEILDAEGNTAVRASAVWLLMDAKTRKMAFPDKYGVKVPDTVTGTELALPAGIQPQDAPVVYRHTARFQDVDINGHMNNSRYIDIVEDALGFRFMHDYELKAFEIGYEEEIRAGKRVALGGAYGDGNIYFEGKTGGRICFRLRAAYRDRAALY